MPIENNFEKPRRAALAGTEGQRRHGNDWLCDGKRQSHHRTRRRLIADQLDELGFKMTKRRLELVAPRTGDIAMNMARAMPGPSMAVVGGALVAGLLMGRRWLRR